MARVSGAISTRQNDNELVTYYYDTKARLNKITSEFNGGLMQKVLEYDAYSRVSKEYYGLSPNGFGVVNEYNNGFLSKIKDETASTTYWEATGYDASGRLIGKKYGDNSETNLAYSNNMPRSVTILQNSSQRIKQTYNWDIPNMRLSSKVDYLKASATATARTITEVYAYDDFNRLQKCTVGNKPLFDIQYDNANGSITSNTNLGSYGYTDADHKHAVTQVDPGILLSIKESIEYTPFDKVSHITEGSKSLDIYYGVDNERLFSLYKCGDATIGKYYYFGNVEVTDGDVIKTQVYLYGPGGVWGLAEKGLGNVYTVDYLHTDYQGTIIAKSNANGITAYSYDAWGRRRNAGTLMYDSAPVSNTFSRGYTGHEHIDELGFINMNGRMYDPLLCRFLSPDNYIQDPYSTDNYNRYAYCLNNPLVYTDPSGEIFGSVITFLWEGSKAIVKSVANVGRELFLEGGLDITSREARRQAWADMDPTANTQMGNAWASFDPTMPGNKTNNALRIDAGLFMHIPGWETPQTLLGNFISHTRNLTGNVDNVDIHNWTVLVNNDEPGVRGWGFTFGPYINSKNLEVGDDTYMHEYGHTLQSRILGPLYITKVAIPSGLSYWFGDEEYHNNSWYEVWASLLGNAPNHQTEYRHDNFWYWFLVATLPIFPN